MSRPSRYRPHWRRPLLRGRVDPRPTGARRGHDRRHGEAQTLHTTHQVTPQPLRRAPGKRGDDDLVEVAFVHRVLYGVERVGAADQSFDRHAAGSEAIDGLVAGSLLLGGKRDSAPEAASASAGRDPFRRKRFSRLLSNTGGRSSREVIVAAVARLASRLVGVWSRRACWVDLCELPHLAGDGEQVVRGVKGLLGGV